MRKDWPQQKMSDKEMDESMDLVEGKLTQADANKATEEGELPPCPKMPEATAWFANDRMNFKFGEPEFPINYYSFGQMLDYARAYARQAIAADRASRQVANKAEAKPLYQVAAPEVVQSFALEDGRCVMGDPDLSILKDGTYWICKAPVYSVTPPATTGGANTTPTGASTSREEVRAFLEEMKMSGKEMNGSYWIPRAVKLLEAWPVGASTVLTDERKRELFEEWAKKQETGYHLDWNVSDRKAQRYYVDRTQNAFKGFCGALDEVAAQASQVAPTEATRPLSDSNARFAIDAAIMFGREGVNRPPTDDHWLFEYWNIGQQLAQLGATSGWDNVTPIAAAGQVAVPGWISVDDRLPEVEQLVMVYAPTSKHEGENISFDCIDPNDDDHSSWLGHNEHYEHFCCVAKPEGSIGPSEKAPYTHWMPLPVAPSPAKESK